MESFIDATKLHAAEYFEMAEETAWMCDPLVEFCATEKMFSSPNRNYSIVTPYIMVGVVYLIDLLYYVIGYLVRMDMR